MRNQATCPECGKPMPEGKSVCPACLMGQALASRTLAETLHGGEAPPDPPSPEEIADKFPQFEIVECLGRGGMGVVYKARQKSLDRWVAIKVLAPERVHDERFAEHFEREAKTLAKMSHPHIVTVHDHGETHGLFYIVMEYIDGVNLRDLLREGKMEPEQALAIVPPICEALEYAHEKGVVHRDIKPENLLLDREGRIKIADFGIASLVGATGESSGTPPYMAPEQSGGTVDRRADIYALGVVLYEMLTGEQPGKDLVAPSKRVEVDVKIDEMVLRALEKEPERRYQTAEEFRTMVETLSGQSHPSPALAGAPRARPAPSAEGSKCSKLAVVGAVWASLACVGLLFVSGGSMSGLSWPRVLLASVVMVGVFTAPVGVTVLGWVAVSRIRRSSGRLHGLGMAVFDGLFFPLLALNAVVILLLASLFDSASSKLGWWEVLILGIPVYLAICVALDIWIVRKVWRALKKASREVTPDVSISGGGFAAANLALFFGFLSALIPTLFYWLRPLHGDWLTDEVVQWAIWATLVAALLALALGWLGRSRSRARNAMIVGGISLTIWMLMFAAGQLSASGRSGKPGHAAETVRDAATIKLVERESRIGNTRLAWRVEPGRPVVVTSGWYALEGDQVVSYHSLPHPVDPVSEPFQLVLEHALGEGELELAMGQGGAGVRAKREVPGSGFRGKPRMDPGSLRSGEYLELWRGECLARDSSGSGEKVLRTYIFGARILAEDEDPRVSRFGEDTRAGRFGDMPFTEERKAVLHDLEKMEENGALDLRHGRMITLTEERFRREDRDPVLFAEFAGGDVALGVGRATEFQLVRADEGLNPTPENLARLLENSGEIERDEGHEMLREDGGIFHVLPGRSSGFTYAFSVTMPNGPPVAGWIELRRIDRQAETLEIRYRLLRSAEREEVEDSGVRARDNSPMERALDDFLKSCARKGVGTRQQMFDALGMADFREQFGDGEKAFREHHDQLPEVMRFFLSKDTGEPNPEFWEPLKSRYEGAKGEEQARLALLMMEVLGIRVPEEVKVAADAWTGTFRALGPNGEPEIWRIAKVEGQYYWLGNPEDGVTGENRLAQKYRLTLRDGALTGGDGAESFRFALTDENNLHLTAVSKVTGEKFIDQVIERIELEQDSGEPVGVEAAAEEESAIRVVVRTIKDGAPDDVRYAIDGEELALEQLAERLRERVREEPDRAVEIVAGADVIYKRIVAVIELLKSAGVEEPRIRLLSKDTLSDDRTEAMDDSDGEVWTCPDHPEVRTPSRGKCPVCAEPLESVSEDDRESGEDEAKGTGEVRLEFRIAPARDEFDDEAMAYWRNLLRAEGKAGKWWEGEKVWRGPLPAYLWLPVTTPSANTEGRVVGEYDGVKHLLVSNKPDDIMLRGRGGGAWGLEAVEAVNASGAGVVITFGVSGGRQFKALTGANIDQALAVVVDGEVVSVPVIRSAMAEGVMICGLRDLDQANELAAKLEGAVSKSAGPGHGGSELPGRRPQDHKR